MKSVAKTHKTDCLSFPARAAPRARRSVWTAAPTTTPLGADEIGHETEVMRAITLAVPASLLLWVPVIWAAAHYL